MLPIASRAGNDRNANAEEAVDFMYGGMTSRHEGCVSAMLTKSALSIASPMRDFKRLVQQNGGCKTTSAAFRGVFRLDSKRGMNRGVHCAFTMAHTDSRRTRAPPRSPCIGTRYRSAQCECRCASTYDAAVLQNCPQRAYRLSLRPVSGPPSFKGRTALGADCSAKGDA
jgi:hypothetical protein